MSKRFVPILVLVALTAGAASLAQNRSDSAFTATGTNCADVSWSRYALQQYPKIAGACQGVLEREGKYHVKFSGEVRRVADRGRTLVVDFKDGDRVTLNPPEDMKIYFSGKPTPVRDLRPGDVLNFYVPQDQLAVQFPEGDPLEVTAPITIAPVGPERVALVPGATMAPGAELPRTASALPVLGLAGLLLLALGASLTTRRRVR